MSKDKPIINIQSLVKKRPLAALLHHLSVWACKAALLQFRYAAGKIYPEHTFSWHVMIFQCIVTILLTDSCLAGCPKLTFKYSVESCILCVCVRVCGHKKKYRELLYHTMCCGHMRAFTPFSPAWCSLSHLSTYQAEKRMKREQMQPDSNQYVGELSFQFTLKETSAQFLVCFCPDARHCRLTMLEKYSYALQSMFHWFVHRDAV